MGHLKSTEPKKALPISFQQFQERKKKKEKSVFFKAEVK